MLADVHQGGAAEVERAINAAAEAWEDWHRMPWEERAAIFLRAAELLAGPWRDTLNAATMLGQSKTAHQAEIDAACELIDFCRFNVEFMHADLRGAADLLAGRLEPDGVPAARGLRLRGHALQLHRDRAATCPRAPALMGNTVVWKPASTAMLSAYYVHAALRGGRAAAGRDQPRLRPRRRDRRTPRSRASTSPASTSPARRRVFQSMWKTIGDNIASYRSYPRIVGETGGKDFIVAHPSADVDAVATAIVRGSFEYQGQKCSAASRVYAPSNLWPELRERLEAEVGSIRMGDVVGLRELHGRRDRREGACKATARRSRRRAAHDDTEIVVGGGVDDSEGFFVEPTVIATNDPDFRLMRDELFGPIVTAYVYPEGEWEETLELVDETAPYALTGAVFSSERERDRGGAGGAPLHGRELLRERQADRRRRRPAAVRRRARVRHERQGRLDVEPDPLGQPADDQGDVRPAERLPLPVPRAEDRADGAGSR